MAESINPPRKSLTVPTVANGICFGLWQVSSVEPVEKLIPCVAGSMCAANTLGMLPSLGLQELNMISVLLVVLPANLSSHAPQLPGGLGRAWRGAGVGLSHGHMALLTFLLCPPPRRKQVLATKAEAEKDGVKVPTTLAEYCIKTKVPSNDNSSDLLYDDLYDDDIDDEDEEEEDADCYDDDDSGNEES